MGPVWTYAPLHPTGLPKQLLQHSCGGRHNLGPHHPLSTAQPRVHSESVPTPLSGRRGGATCTRGSIPFSGRRARLVTASTISKGPIAASSSPPPETKD